MEILSQAVSQEIIRLTWRNPAFMAISIAMIWLIPQLIIRRILSNNYEKKKFEKQKDKISKLYPKNSWIKRKSLILNLVENFLIINLNEL